MWNMESERERGKGEKREEEKEERRGEEREWKERKKERKRKKGSCSGGKDASKKWVVGRGSDGVTEWQF